MPRRAIHPTHKMTEWRGTAVTITSTPRFGEIRHCEYCEAEHAKTVAGEGVHPELYERCECIPEGEPFVVYQPDIVKLKRLNEVAEKFQELLHSRVEEVIQRYIAANRGTAGHNFPSRSTYQFPADEWQLVCDGDEVEVSWDDFTSHHDDTGMFRFPAKYLYNEDALLALEEKCRGEKAEADAEEQEEQRQKDEAELVRLQEKLGKK